VILGVNLWGVIHGCHVFLTLPRRQDERHIVNTSHGDEPRLRTNVPPPSNRALEPRG
jgi:hypothetical protein